MADQAFRQRTILQYGLEAVVSLPAVGGNPAASILAFETENPGREVLMTASTGQGMLDGLTGDKLEQALALITIEGVSSSRDVSHSEISANDYNLQPERYVLSAEAARLETLLSSAETISLGDLVEIYRPQPSPSARNMEPDAPEADYASVKELVVSDLSDLGLASSPSKHLQVSQAQLHGLRRAELHPGDIVLVTKGSVGKVGLILQIPSGETWVANQSFAILRLRRSGPFQTPNVLFRYLNSRMGQGLLQGLKVGTAVSTLQMADLKRLPVVIPDVGTQALVVEQMDRLLELQSKIDTLRAEQADMQAQIWPENLAGQSA
jgi:type I restriction enzyme M protein